MGSGSTRISLPRVALSACAFVAAPVLVTAMLSGANPGAEPRKPAPTDASQRVHPTQPAMPTLPTREPDRVVPTPSLPQPVPRPVPPSVPVAARPPQWSPDPGIQCKLPPAGAHDHVTLVGVGGGRAVSTATLGSMNRVTTTIKVTVQPNGPRAYLMLFAETSTIWRFEGDTDRISKVVVMGTPGGVTGLPADVVAFYPGQKCGVATGSFQTASVQRTLGEAIGRDTGSVGVIFTDTMSIGSVMLTSYDTNGGTVQTSSGGERRRLAGDGKEPTPTGFDAASFEDAKQYWPLGLDTVDDMQVISSEPSLDYVVLPGHFGVAQLVGAGKLRRIRDGGITRFRIEGTVDFLPAMSPKEKAVYVLPKGVPMPKGKPVNTCVVDEDEGSVLYGLPEVCGLSVR